MRNERISGYYRTLLGKTVYIFVIYAVMNIAVSMVTFMIKDTPVYYTINMIMLALLFSLASRGGFGVDWRKAKDEIKTYRDRFSENILYTFGVSTVIGILSVLAISISLLVYSNPQSTIAAIIMTPDNIRNLPEIIDFTIGMSIIAVSADMFFVYTLYRVFEKEKLDDRAFIMSAAIIGLFISISGFLIGSTAIENSITSLIVNVISGVGGAVIYIKTKNILFPIIQSLLFYYNIIISSGVAEFFRESEINIVLFQMIELTLISAVLFLISFMYTKIKNNSKK